LGWKSVYASGDYAEDHLETPTYPFYHETRYAHSFDHLAIRRGFQVYDSVGKACHSLGYNYYRELIDVCFTEEEVIAIAAQQEGYKSEPDDFGEVHERTGVINDRYWAPYANDNEARASNNGALPPDLSLITKSRFGGPSYVFALLTGYRDPPHGVRMSDNMFYNIYFPGCQIGMPPPLAAGQVEYTKRDGSGTFPASVSQMARDVSTFLDWSASKDTDERKLMGGKALICVWLAIPFMYNTHRKISSTLKNRMFYGKSTK